LGEGIAAAAGPHNGSTRLQVIGRFSLVIEGKPARPSLACRRVMAVLALRNGHAGRREIAGILWPSVPAARAAANLRSVLWRAHQCCLGVVECGVHDLRLSAGVVVDVHQVLAMARRLINRSITMDLDELNLALGCNFHDDLLPEMGNEEWLATEVEWYRQLRLHALDSLSERLTQLGWNGAAVDVALRAVRVDPFRESAQLALMQAYLAEGNQIAARRQYAAYRDMLNRELGAEPSMRLRSIVEGA
jgi:DNA-binding SARP family transcriptional activator